jgi:hypothetical protein
MLFFGRRRSLACVESLGGAFSAPNDSDHHRFGIEIRAIAALNALQGSPRTLKRCGYRGLAVYP